MAVQLSQKRGLVNSATDIGALTAALGASSAGFLGAGTFGETWQVEGIPGLPASCAVKLLRTGSFNPKRLAREVDSLTRFDFAGIMKLYEVRIVALPDGPQTALICEHIPGGEVKQRIEDSGLPKPSTVRKFAIGLLDAVRELHEADTWHRDIKPANILLRDGRWSSPVLIDFGLARAASDATMTAYPQQVGTLLYMAPEALRGEPARKLADIWSCGVVIYQLLTGRHPFITDFDGLLADDFVDLVVGDPFPLPEGIPPDLQDVVIRLLSQAPYSRGTAARALEDLRRA